MKNYVFFGWSSVIQKESFVYCVCVWINSFKWIFDTKYNYQVDMINLANLKKMINHLIRLQISTDCRKQMMQNEWELLKIMVVLLYNFIASFLSIAKKERNWILNLIVCIKSRKKRKWIQSRIAFCLD